MTGFEITGGEDRDPVDLLKAAFKRQVIIEISAFQLQWLACMWWSSSLVHLSGVPPASPGGGHQSNLQMPCAMAADCMTVHLYVLLCG